MQTRAFSTFERGRQLVLLSSLALLLCACGGAPAEELALEDGELSLQSSASWTRVGESLPAIVEVDADRSLPHVLYASAGDAVFVSWSFGQSWSAAKLAGQAQGVVVDPNHPGRALAYANDALYETRDAGLRWRRLPGTLPGALLAIAPGDSNVLWAGRSPQLFKSVDRGVTWTTLDFGGPGGCCLDLVALSSTDLYASAYYAQLQRSLDGGASWPLSTFADLYMVPTFAVDREQPALVYAGNSVSYGPTGLRKSTDGGRSWTAPNAELASALITQVALGPDRLYVVLNDDDPAALRVSTDSALTFTPATTVGDARTLRVFPHPSWPCLAYAIADGALYRTATGAGSCR